jgi:uncharacterized protein
LSQDLFSNFTTLEAVIFYCVAILIGMSKAGVHGAGMAAVPLMAGIFGGQTSSGIMLPMLCMADAIGVWYYNRHASWEHLKKLFPWTVLGTIAGTYVGGHVDDDIFRLIMAVAIFSSIGLMFWLNRGHREDIPDYKCFAAFTGVAAGFTSMIGNLAGSVMAIYFLSMRLPKNSFIGTTAWFFLVINLFKIPFHIFAWNTIRVDTVLLNVTALPAIMLGAVAGIYIVKKLSEKTYRWFIITMTLMAALLMLR